MNYFGKDVQIDITVSHILNQDQTDDLVADLSGAAREVNETQLALANPFFYSAATGALDLIPGQSFGED